MTELPFTPAVRAGDWVIVSGQIGIVDGRLADGVGEQTRVALENLHRQLRSHGLSFKDLARVGVYLTSMSDYEPMNDAYGGAFDGTFPARTAVAVNGLPRGALVEIEGMAYAPLQS